MAEKRRRFYSLNEYLQKTFGQKVYKISLHGNMTCPNRDGTVGSRGCIFCSRGGSGEFAADKLLAIPDQIEQAKSLVAKKIKNGKYIAYFQAFTNTYAPVDYLEGLFLQAISHPDVAALSVATRPDCLPAQVLQLLERLNAVKPVWVELGLQTIHQNTAEYIRRGYDLPCFDTAVRQLKEIGITTVVHVILGLPGETEQDMVETVRYLNGCKADGVKLQLLHILKGTDLEKEYRRGKIQVLEKDAYIHILIDCLENLSPEIVVHRITGDSPHGMLVAPKWSEKKWEILNAVDAEMRRLDSFQGKALNVKGFVFQAGG